MADIFISYAREDREWVEKLAATLLAEGFSVWWDWDLLVGKRYRETIETELQLCKATIVVWSENSVRSDFVRDEAEEGQQRNLLLPVLKDQTRPPAGFRQIQTADLSSWTGDRTNEDFRRMMRGVSHLVGRQANQPVTVPLSETGGAQIAEPTAAPTQIVQTPSAVADSSPLTKQAAGMSEAAPQPRPAPASAGAPPFSVPAAFAGLNGKFPPSNHPLWRYVAIGVVAVLALIFVISQFVAQNPVAKPSGGNKTVHVYQGPNNNGANANGDVSGNSRGPSGSSNGGGNATTPNDGGDTGQGGNGAQPTGGGNANGNDNGDVGQGH